MFPLNCKGLSKGVNKIVTEAENSRNCLGFKRLKLDPHVCFLFTLSSGSEYLVRGNKTININTSVFADPLYRSAYLVFCRLFSRLLTPRAECATPSGWLSVWTHE